MISISAIKVAQGAERYFFGRATAVERYYIQSSAAAPRWTGSAVSSLGLESTPVDARTLRFMLEGLSPDGTAPLVQHQRGRTRQPGWDITVSMPKGMSVLWALSNERNKARLEEAAWNAASEAFRSFEREAAWSRRGRGGKRLEPVSLIAAPFLHTLSRANDPQLHFHLLVPNVGVRSDGSTGTVVSKRFYEHKMASVEVFRRRLTAELEALGLEVRHEQRSNFTVVDVAGVPPSLCRSFSTRRAAIEETLRVQGESSASASEVAALATRTAKRKTSPEALIAKWEATALEHGFSFEKANALFAANARVSETSYEHIPKKQGRVFCIEAPPRGPKNTEAMRNAVETHRREGYRVHGLAPTQELATKCVVETGIAAESFGRFFENQSRTAGDHVAHAARQLGRAAVGHYTYPLPTFALNEKTLLLVQHAESADSRDLHRLLEAAERAEARVILVGAASSVREQWPSAFSSLCKRYGSVRLPDDLGSLPRWRVEAEAALGRGDKHEALRLFADNGHAREIGSRGAAITTMAAEWVTRSSKDVLLVGEYQRDAHELNVAVQAERHRRGELGLRQVKAKSGAFRTNDRVRFLHGNRALGVPAGACATIKSISRERAVGPFDRTIVTVVLDQRKASGLLRVPRQHEVRLSGKGLDALELAYAADLRRARSQPHTSALLLLHSQHQGHECIYEAVSRCKEARLFTMFSLDANQKEGVGQARHHARDHGKEQSL